MAITTYGDINQRTADYVAKTMLDHAEPILVLSKFAQIKPIPGNTASSVAFRRPIPFKPALRPLVEGVTPQSHKISYEDVRMRLQQFGDLAEITDWVDDLSEDPVMQNIISLSGEQAAETEEMLLWGAIKAGTNRIFTTGSQRSQVNGVLTLTKIRAAVRTLQRNRAKKITSILDGSTNVMTRPVEASYVAFAHTDLAPDIRNLPGFVPCAQYGNRSVLSPYEFGDVEDIRFILSPLLEPYPDAGDVATGAGNPVVPVLSTGGMQADVYPVVIVTRDYYATCPLAGKGAIKPIVINPMNVDKSDPLGQRGYVGWKTYWAGGILNEAWGIIIEAAASSLA